MLLKHLSVGHVMLSTSECSLHFILFSKGKPKNTIRPPVAVCECGQDFHTAPYIMYTFCDSNSIHVCRLGNRVSMALVHVWGSAEVPPH